MLIVAMLYAAIESRAQGIPQPLAFAVNATVTTLPNGVELHDAGATLRVTALRDDVLRVRVTRNGALPEDASWAVLPASRTATIAVTPEMTATSAGFRTALAHVAIDRRSGTVRITDLNGRVLREDAAPVEFQTDGSFRLTEAMPADEHYFGLGDKTGPSDRRGRAFAMWNTDTYRFQEFTDPLYKDIPFFLSFRAGTATGTLLDNTWRSSFDFGKDYERAYSFGAANGPVDVYLMLGPTPRQVVEAYAWLTGIAPLPPRWMLGYQQSRFTYTPEARLLEVATRLRADRIPADALYLDIDFQDRHRPFTVNTDDFPDIQQTLAKLRAMHFHTVAITDLHIANAPGQGYVAYDSGMAGNEFLHNADGSVYTGKVWPGAAVFPDFTQVSTRKWWGTLYRPFHTMGFEGFWNDMSEPSIFDSRTSTIDETALHRVDEPGFVRRTGTHAEFHNVYGMENSRATYDGLLALDPNQRPFVLTRATYAGGQRYAATWTGDNSSTWNHLRMVSPMLKSLGLAGFSFVGADAGGFAGSPSPELLTKWLEVAAFQPIDRSHAEKGTHDKEPWVDGTMQEDLRRHYIETRYELMPYLYTLADETARTGLPMLRPIFLDYPNAAHDGRPLDIDGDQNFLLGHDLLIAPSPYGEAPDAYTVEFPSTHWYDFWTGEAVAPSERAKAEDGLPPVATDQVDLYTSVKPALATLPVFVRGGAILPMAPLTQSTDETPSGPLTLRVYAGDDCRGELYTDDGHSFAYRSGDFLRMNFTCTVSPDGLRLELSKHTGRYPAWWQEVRVEIYGWLPTRNTADADGRSLTLTKEASHIVFTAPDAGTGTVFELR
ncbi:MAG TPA: TIM-barrel domain-containing protein [Terracidiphilus sp.]|nr:TIM-barrel domain-containing protein [Terracidiphilus sp.]